MNEDGVIDAVDYLEKQDQLDYQAYEALPYKFDTCTFNVPEAKRQTIFSCLTCKVGICYSCSISCEHYKHDLIEVGSKKNFSCECGTLVHDKNVTCNLFDKKHIDYDLVNQKNHNFEGKYCFCGENPPSEGNDEMVQCALGHMCGEDWFHLKCLKLDEHRVTADDFEELICEDCHDMFSNEFGIMRDTHKSLSNIIFNVIDSPRYTCGFHPILLLNNDYQRILNRVLEVGPKQSNQILSKFFSETVYHDIVEPYKIYEPPREEFKSTIKVDDTNYITDEDAYSKSETDLMRIAVKEKQLNIDKFMDFKSGLKSFLTGFAENKEVVTKKHIESYFQKLKTDSAETAVDDDLSKFSDPESELEELESE